MNAKKHDDVIVVGAGPAGASAAYALARAGVRVLILEKEKLPRYKTCGGGLPRKAVDALAFDVRPVLDQPITASLATSEFARPIRHSFETPIGWCVMRASFDNYLTQQAVGAGARCLTGQTVRRLTQTADRVEVDTMDETYAASCVLGADGVNGPVARLAGLGRGRQYAVALEAEITVSAAALLAWQQTLHIHFGGAPWGYAWVFPKANHLSAGVATFQNRRPVDLRAYLKRFLASQPLLREHQTKVLRGQRIPLGGQLLPLHSGRVLLAGDAGGFADPFLGEGIYYAIRSGQMAANIIAQTLRGRAEPADYTREANARFHTEFRYARVFAGAFYRLPGLACRLFGRSRRLQAFSLSMLSDTFSFRRAYRALPRQGGRVLLELARGS